ncbi:MAG: TetR/AcrR family transcriptional regulator [Acidimicrobiales bacterium]|nr:TetR/AcrR family transcriptional regulator [Acidimicrobiales bacterium]
MTARRLTTKGQATRNRIIDSATAMFASDGYAAASIRDIAARSGVSSGAIYATFSGKAEILAEAVSASIASDLEDLGPDVLDQPFAKIVAQQYAHLNDPGRRRLRLLLLQAAAAARTDPEVRERLGKTLRQRIDAWTGALEGWQRDDDIDPSASMRALVLLLVGADVGMAVLGELGVRSPTDEQASGIVALLLASLPDASRRAPSEHL